MNCARTRQVLDALVDRELDAATESEIGTHLAACAECAGLRAARVALRERVRKEAPYFPAPSSLQGAIARALDSAESGGGRPAVWPAMRPTWAKAGLLAASAAAASLALGIWLGRPPVDDALRDPAVASHVASLSITRRLIDIASSDRHAIKPWFAGKLDFAPPVLDLSAEGYALTGARLDHVGDRQAAAIVYRMRNHDINLFVWRASAESRREETTLAFERGFAVATWAQDGLRFAATSDLDGRDLERFAALVRKQR